MYTNKSLNFADLIPLIILIPLIAIAAISNNFAIAQMEITPEENNPTPIFNETTSESDEPKPIILDSTLSTNSYSSYIGGEVLNNFTYPIESVQITASVYDKNNVLIATSDSSTIDDQIKAGEKSGFSINLSDKVPKSSRYVLTSTFEESGEAKPEFLKLIVGKVSKGSLGLDFKIVGEVTNNGQDAATYVKVSGIFYDKSHKVLDTDYTYTKPDTIEPGKKAPFELSMFSSDAKKVKSVAVNVQSNEYSMISNDQLDSAKKG